GHLPGNRPRLEGHVWTAHRTTRVRGRGDRHGKKATRLRLLDPRRPHERTQEIRPKRRTKEIPVLQTLSQSPGVTMAESFPKSFRLRKFCEGLLINPS